MIILGISVKTKFLTSNVLVFKQPTIRYQIIVNCDEIHNPISKNCIRFVRHYYSVLT